MSDNSMNNFPEWTGKNRRTERPEEVEGFKAKSGP